MPYTLHACEWLTLFSTGVPTNRDEQALAALYFFPNDFLSEMNADTITLTSVQETNLFALISMQGLLMGGHYDIKEPELCNFAKQYMDAMAKYWVLSYGSIWRNAMQIGCVSGSTINRAEILKETFVSACHVLIENETDLPTRVRVKKAIAFMQKNNIGLHDCSEVDSDEATLYGIEVLRTLVNGKGKHELVETGAVKPLPFEVLEYHTDGITVEWNGKPKRIKSKIFGAKLAELCRTGESRVKASPRLTRDNLKNNDFLNTHFKVQIDRGATYLARRD